jgi:hypothetical protein
VRADRLRVTTDELLPMVQRRVTELWRVAGSGVEAITIDWAKQYQELTRGVAAAPRSASHA